MHNIQQHTCSNGLTLITQYIPNVKTISLHWGVRAGVAMNVCDGESVLLAELLQRGVHGLTARQHTDALDALGVQKHVSCGTEFMRISAVLLGNRFYEALPLLGAYFLRPTLPENELQACKNLCLQSLAGLGDNPSHMASVALNEYHLPAPFNRSCYGTEACIKQTTIEKIQEIYTSYIQPKDSIMAVAGVLEHERVVEEVESLVSGWVPKKIDTLQQTKRERGAHTIEQDSSQVHVAFAFDAPNAAEESSILESIAMFIFGGASSGRLFTQVRQRRSLCYSVSARYAPTRERSAVRMYAGTTPDRAKETVDVCLEQLSELTKGITQDEFDRAIQRMKSRTVMHGESTAARAGALFGDQYALGKPRTLEDIMHEIDAVKFDEVNLWLANRTIGEITFVSVGPNAIELSPTALGL